MLLQELGRLHDGSNSTPHSEFLAVSVQVAEAPRDSNSRGSKLSQCEICGRCFKRPQERTRHLRQVHQPQRKCPFQPCAYNWKRPDKINAHITNVHGSKLCPLVTEGVRALRGKEVTEFVDAYDFERPDGTYVLLPLPLLASVAPSGESELYLRDYCECRLERIDVVSGEGVVEQTVKEVTASR